jgi:hypothetical protein
MKYANYTTRHLFDMYRLCELNKRICRENRPRKGWGISVQHDLYARKYQHYDVLSERLLQELRLRLNELANVELRLLNRGDA